jgi:ribonuclease HII
VEALACAPEHVLVDARRIKGLAMPQQAIVRGDSLSLSIAAASIIAKTSRDAVMQDLDLAHPGYGFAQHKGYPVRAHRVALQRLGPTPVHRRSFAAVRAVLGLPPLPPWPAPEDALA